MYQLHCNLSDQMNEIPNQRELSTTSGVFWVPGRVPRALQIQKQYSKEANPKEKINNITEEKKTTSNF